MSPNKIDIYLYFKMMKFFHHLSSYDEYKIMNFSTKVNKISNNFTDDKAM